MMSCNTIWTVKDKFEYFNYPVWLGVAPSDYVKRSSFYFTVMGRFDSIQGYEIRRTSRDDYLVLFTIEGSGFIEANGRKFKTEKNHICVINCKNPHSYRAEGKWSFWWMHIKGAGVEYLYEQMAELSPEGTRLVSEAEIGSLFESFAETVKNGYDTSEPTQSFIIHNILYHAISAMQDYTSCKPYFPDVFAYIEENYMNQITIDDMARAALKSRYYFMRRFKKMTGETPYRYLINFRIGKSKELLLNTDKPVAEIAKLCGFLDESNFISRFKRREGITPSEYRKRTGQ